jgi:GNAT superfamily N-acetyltransferase
MGEIAYRPAAKPDIPSLSAIFADAFDDDPPFVWALPDPVTRRRRLTRIFGTMFRHEPAGRVEIATRDDEILGGALWLPPDHWNETVRAITAMPGFLRGFGRRISYGSMMMDASKKVHPTEPHWHLTVVAVARTAQGTGVGARLIRRGLARCDSAKLPAYLESTKTANVPLYEHFGFERTGKLPLPTGAPDMITMWRPGRN